MSLVLLLLIFLIPYSFCKVFFTRIPEKIIPGEIINLQWNYTDNKYTNKKFNIDIELCHKDMNECKKLVSSKSNFNQVNATLIFKDEECFFKEKDIDGWFLIGNVMNGDHIEEHFTSNNIERELVCGNDKCKENLCIQKNTPAVLPNNNSNVEKTRTVVPVDSSNKASNGFSLSKNILGIPIFAILIVITLSILIFATGSFLYVRRLKKKVKDPIPIFSVEDSSYCCDINNSPVLGNDSYPPNGMEKSFLNVNMNQQRSPSIRTVDQSHLSVQLHPVNDGVSHHSHSSNRLKNVTESEISYRTSPELKKNNDLNGINSDNGSPFLTSLSPISMSTSLYVQSPKPARNDSIRYDKTNNKYYHISSAPNVYTDSIITESQLFSEKMSDIVKKRSFNSYNNSHNEEDIKLLSSKHYILSNFEGDYNKEELNLHYGDIVSVINILPDGWAYGELLLKYDSYTKTNVKPFKGSKYRKFGYYPLRCITPEEESEETNTPPKNLLEEDDSKDLKLINISTDEDETESINKNYTIEKEKLSEKDSDKSLPPPIPTTHSKYHT